MFNKLQLSVLEQLVQAEIDGIKSDLARPPKDLADEYCGMEGWSEQDKIDEIRTTTQEYLEELEAILTIITIESLP